MISICTGSIGFVVNVLQDLRISNWIWIIVALMGLSVAQFLAYHHRVNKDRDERQVKEKATTTDYIFIIENRDYWFIENTARLVVKMGFYVSPTMRVESIRLDLMDKSIPSDWTPHGIGGAPEERWIHFDFPDWVTTGEYTAKIIAFAEGVKAESRPFKITFSEERLRHKIDEFESKYR